MSEPVSMEDVRREQDLALKAVAVSVRRELELALQAVAASVKERIDGIRPVTVTVDMTPVAKSIDRMTTAIAQQSELLARLASAVANQKPPTVEVKPALMAPVAPVPPEATPRKPRKLTVTHGDGTKSTITEE